MATVDRLLPHHKLERNKNGSLTVIETFDDGSCSFIPLAFENLDDYADWIIRNMDFIPAEFRHEFRTFANNLKGL